jgi:hypothetical protein
MHGVFVYSTAVAMLSLHTHEMAVGAGVGVSVGTPVGASVGSAVGDAHSAKSSTLACAHAQSHVHALVLSAASTHADDAHSAAGALAFVRTSHSVGVPVHVPSSSGEPQ